MVSDLTARQKFEFFASNLLASAGIDNRVRVALAARGDLYVATVAGRDITIPSAARWRLYKRGWEHRIAHLSHCFGVGDVVHVRPGDVTIDIGANVGEFSAAMAGLGATVHAIEGDPLVFRCLEYNTREFASVKRYENVIWNDDTEVTFYSEPADANSSIFRSRGDAPLTVAAQKLDTFASHHGIEDVTFLKCDAEGAEPEVIEGGRELLGRTRVAAFDTGPERLGEETSEDCEKLLKSLGFTVHHALRQRRKITFGVRP